LPTPMVTMEPVETMIRETLRNSGCALQARPASSDGDAGDKGVPSVRSTISR